MSERARVKPRLMSGIQEYLPHEQALFEHLKGIIRGCFQDYGFTPLETPTLELSEVLLAKGGGDTDKEIYRFEKGKNDIALPFDLTVPLARYVAQHHGTLTFPFRRYQIQKVWRAERAQKGRYREFYQCDVDIVGCDELAADAEIVAVMYVTLLGLEVPNFRFQLNNRKIYRGFLESLGYGGQAVEILRVLDKSRKIGWDSVRTQLQVLGMSESVAGTLVRFAGLRGRPAEVLLQLKEQALEHDLFVRGVSELEEVCRLTEAFGVPEETVEIDMSMTRGLDYYTGTICETYAEGFEELGSICSGGRYDNLVTHFCDRPFPGVGMSIGLSRLFVRLKELHSAAERSLLDLVVIPTEERLTSAAIEAASLFRRHGVRTEVLYKVRRLQRQFRYADQAKARFALVLGEDEVCQGIFSFKNMKTGEQMKVAADQAEAFIPTLLDSSDATL